jgi:hypothetical protein
MYRVFAGEVRMRSAGGSGACGGFGRLKIMICRIKYSDFNKFFSSLLRARSVGSNQGEYRSGLEKEHQTRIINPMEDSSVLQSNGAQRT